jgi:hypothetical protein
MFTMPNSPRTIRQKIWANFAEILFQLELGFLEHYLNELLGTNLLRILL